MSNNGAREKRVEKLQIMASDSEIAKIDDWRFGNRAPSRSSAIRMLIFLGMSYWEKHPEEAAEQVKDSLID